MQEKLFACAFLALAVAWVASAFLYAFNNPHLTQMEVLRWSLGL